MAPGLIFGRNLLEVSFKRLYKSMYLVNSVTYRLNNPVYQPKTWSSNCALTLTGRKCHYNIEHLDVPVMYSSIRCYAKSRDKKKSDKGQKKKVHIDEQVLAEVIDATELQNQMNIIVEKLKDEFIKNLSLRSTSGAIESLPVTFEGKEYILQDLAQIVRKNPKTVVINMTAFPQAIPSVLQGISKSGMNLNPQQDGTTLFIPIPKITKEHRENLSKNARALFVKCKDGISEVRNKFIKTVKNKERDGLSKDVANQISDYISSVAHENVANAEKMLEAKQQELLKES